MTRNSRGLFRTVAFLHELEAATDHFWDRGGYELADRFLSAVELAIERIAENPTSAPQYQPPEGYEELVRLRFRAFNLLGLSPFPYAIYYVIEPGRIVIRAIHHQSRDLGRHLRRDLT